MFKVAHGHSYVIHGPKNTFESKCIYLFFLNNNSQLNVVMKGLEYFINRSYLYYLKLFKLKGVSNLKLGGGLERLLLSEFVALQGLAPSPSHPHYARVLVDVFPINNISYT